MIFTKKEKEKKKDKHTMHASGLVTFMFSIAGLLFCVCTEEITVCRQFDPKTYNPASSTTSCLGQSVFTESKGEKGDRGIVNDTEIVILQNTIKQLQSK